MTVRMGVDEARRAIAQTMTEAELLGWVSTTARMCGWLAYHTHDSRRSEAGFPDLCLVRDDQVIFAELKSMKGKVTDAQQRWLDALDLVAGVTTYVWRPSDLDSILEVLA